MRTSISYPDKHFRLFESSDEPHIYVELRLYYAHRTGYRIIANGFTIQTNRLGHVRRTSLRYDGGWMFQAFLSIFPDTKFKQRKFDFLYTSINYGFYEKEIAELLELFCHSNQRIVRNKTDFLNRFHVYTGCVAKILEIPTVY